MLINDPLLTVSRWMSNSSSHGAPSLPVDAVRTDEGVELRFDLPGVDLDDIELTVDEGVLRLAVRRSLGVDDHAVVARERWHGEHSRSFRLTKGIDTDRLSSSYAAGVLTVRIPRAVADQPRRISIDVDTPSLAA